MKKIFIKLVNSLYYSVQGLQKTYLHEKSFRWEVKCSIPLLIWLIWHWSYHNFPSNKLIIVIASYLLILITELINTALERIVDEISDGKKSYSYAMIKECGSSAVFLSLVIFIIVFLFYW